MPKKALLILVALSLLTFANALSNGFIGDDHLLISDNDFYRTWKNIPQLFSRDYLTDTSDLIRYGQAVHSSGSVAYRPVLSLTYFLDYQLWGTNPSGYHATNIFLHLINSLLVCLLLWRIMGSQGPALLAAILFSIHPLKSEPVCNIGYRADILFSLFALCAVHCYLNCAEDKRFRHRVGLTLFYALALFTKEAALALIPVLLAYEYIIKGTRSKTLGEVVVKRLGGILIVTGLYLLIYTKIFSNTTFTHLHLLNGSLVAHIKTMLMIFSLYTYHLFFPFTVNLVPPLYTPALGQGDIFLSLAGTALLVLLITGIIHWRVKQPAVSFFILWYLLALLPVANFIPLENPMAHRFLYFPSIGAAALLAWGISSLGKAKALIAAGFVGLMIILTAMLNLVWRSDEIYGSYLVKNYPKDKSGYVILGHEYFKRGLFPEAAYVLKKSIELGVNDPRVYYLCGQSAMRDPQEAIYYLTAAIKLRPDYVLPYIALGRAYLFWGKTTLAENYLRQSLDVFPTVTGYGYLLQLLIKEGKADEANGLFDKAKEKLNNEPAIHSLTKIMEDIGQADKYIDIGI